MKKFLIFIIISKPILDLFWDLKFAGVNVSGFVAGLLSLIYIMTLITDYKKHNLYVNKYSFFLSLYAIFISTTFFVIFGKSNTFISSLSNCFRLVSPMIILVYLGKNCDIEDIERIMKLYILVSLIPILISFLQVYGLIDYTYWDYVNGIRIPRASGGYRQPSVLTRILMFTNIFCLYFIRVKSINVKKYKIYLVVSSLSLFFTFHRTGYLIIVLVFILWMMFYINISWKFLLKTTCMIILVMFIFIILDFSGKIHTGFVDIMRSMLSIDNIFKLQDGKFELVLRGRGNIIQDLIYILHNQPLYLSILGNGIDNNSYTNLSMQIADMDWIRMLWQYGILGGVLWVAQLLSFIKGILKLKKHKCMSARYDSMLNVGLLSVLCYIIMGCTIEATMSPNFMYLIYLFMSFILGNKYMFINDKRT